MNTPTATYRIQFNSGFKFSQLLDVLPYLHQLGVSTIYASPVFKATPGSVHGYDVTDPGTINPEIGSLEDFYRVIEKTKTFGMTWLQDIVPNHMAFHQDNFRLMDVLERGPYSEFYNYFDIDWNHKEDDLKGKVMVPFLGKDLEEVLEARELKVDVTDQGFVVKYFDSCYPISVSALPGLLRHATISEDEIRLLHERGSTKTQLALWSQHKHSVVKLLLREKKKHEEIRRQLDLINNDPPEFNKILNEQFYRLCHWNETSERINYRRFFTVNGLICLRMEDDDVFDDYHKFVIGLVKERRIDGVRIDHIDGLCQPPNYTQKLRQTLGNDCYMIAEKILESKEKISADWSIEGTSGYEFLSYLNQLMTNRQGARVLRNFYKTLVPGQSPYQQIVQANKTLILEKYMQGEWQNLTDMCFDLNLADGIAHELIKQTIGAFLISMPVYRIYPAALPLNGTAQEVVQQTLARASTNFPHAAMGLRHFEKLFLGSNSDNSALKFLNRLMQFSGPLTAKGVEDTTFYNYNALLSHDEVGDSPATLGISIVQFHRQMVERQLSTPLSLNTTSTHDTKRGEDARVRLNALCELADEWIELVKTWLEVNTEFRSRTSKGLLAPGVNDQYFIYQSLVAGIPEDFVITARYLERLGEYMRKVLREGKRRSDWADPDTEYEDACISFIHDIVRPESAFMKGFIPLMHKVQGIANRYAVAQVLIKIAAPGIPDIYQGCELWDLSYVDPDNRRPVDFQTRQKFLQEIEQLSTQKPGVIFEFVTTHQQKGFAKMFTLWKALTFRREHPSLFTDGEYIPLQLSGKDSVTLSFARMLRNEWVVVVVLLKRDDGDFSCLDEVLLPASAPKQWKNIFTGQMIETEGRLSLADVLVNFPVAMLAS